MEQEHRLSATNEPFSEDMFAAVHVPSEQFASPTAPIPKLQQDDEERKPVFQSVRGIGILVTVILSLLLACLGSWTMFAVYFLQLQEVAFGATDREANGLISFTIDVRREIREVAMHVSSIISTMNGDVHSELARILLTSAVCQWHVPIHEVAIVLAPEPGDDTCVVVSFLCDLHMVNATQLILPAPANISRLCRRARQNDSNDNTLSWSQTSPHFVDMSYHISTPKSLIIHVKAFQEGLQRPLSVTWIHDDAHSEQRSLMKRAVLLVPKDGGELPSPFIFSDINAISQHDHGEDSNALQGEFDYGHVNESIKQLLAGCGVSDPYNVDISNIQRHATFHVTEAYDTWVAPHSPLTSKFLCIVLCNENEAIDGRCDRNLIPAHAELVVVLGERLSISRFSHIAAAITFASVILHIYIWFSVASPMRTLSAQMVATLSGSNLPPYKGSKLLRALWATEAKMILALFKLVQEYVIETRPFIPSFIQTQMFQHLGKTIAAGRGDGSGRDDWEPSASPLIETRGMVANWRPISRSMSFRLQPQQHQAPPTTAFQQVADDTVGVCVMRHREHVTFVCVVLGNVERGYSINHAKTQRCHAQIFGSIIAAVEAHSGTMMANRGDRIIIVWNAFEKANGHVMLGVACAARISRLFPSVRKMGLAIGIAVHTGPALCGIVGGPSFASHVVYGHIRQQATSIADLAMRLSCTTILATDTIKQQISHGYHFIAVDALREGDDESSFFETDIVTLFAVLPDNELLQSPSPLGVRTTLIQKIAGQIAEAEQSARKNTYLLGYHRAWTAFRDHEFEEANMQVAQLKKTCGNDLYLRRLLKLCKLAAEGTLPIPKPYFRTFPQWTSWDNALGCSRKEGSLRGRQLWPEAFDLEAPESALLQTPSTRTEGGVSFDEENLAKAVRSQAQVQSTPHMRHVQPPAATAVDSFTNLQALPGGGGAKESSSGRDTPQSPFLFQSQHELPYEFVSLRNIVYHRSSRTLGTGSFGAVYLGMELHSGRFVALKILPLPEDWEQREKLCTEVEIMESVKSTHIVRFTDIAFHVDSNRIILVMDMIAPGAVSTIMEAFRTIPPVTAVNFVRDVLRGLRRLHEMGIIHRDVKPQNVLISADGEACISDFGAAALLGGFAKSTQLSERGVVGTPLYMAPEAARGTPCVKSDIWSVGIMFLEMTTGHIPYEADRELRRNAAVFVFQIGSGILKPQFDRKGMTPVTLEFVDRCLDPDCQTRASADELLNLPFFSV